MYFLAILAPQAVNSKVLDWKYYMREHYGCVVAMRSPAHITLVPPFWMSEVFESTLVADVESFCSQQQSFRIEVENFDAFRPKVIFLHVKPTVQLSELRSALENHLLSKEKYPIKPEVRPFHPHITIANRDLLRKDFSEAFKHFNKIAYTKSFVTDGIAVLKHLGGEWTILKNFPFKK